MRKQILLAIVLLMTLWTPGLIHGQSTSNPINRTLNDHFCGYPASRQDGMIRMLVP